MELTIRKFLFSKLLPRQLRNVPPGQMCKVKLPDLELSLIVSPMGLLKRVLARKSGTLWDVETRVMHSFGMVRAPIAVQWLSTMTCDLTCPHCYVSAGKKSQNELNTEEVKRLVVDPMVDLECSDLVIAGGEPLLRKDMSDIVAYAASRGIAWSMHTHGGFVRKCLPWIQDVPPTMVAVSLDGPPTYHDNFRGKEHCFDKAVDAISALQEIGVDEVVAGTTVTRQNADLLVDMMPLVIASGADSWGLHLVAPEGRAQSDLLPTKDQLQRVAQMARRARSYMRVELDNEWGSAAGNDLLYRDSIFSCGAGRFSCVVGATGNVSACTTTDPHESEGNVRENGLKEIWLAGFDRFRTSSGICGDSTDCWLQTRNGHSPKVSAFGTTRKSLQVIQ